MEHSEAARCGVELRPAAELGRTSHRGLSGRHHFSFAAYQRLDRLEWGGLRAVNLYRLEAGEMRAPTFHAGFEILTLVTSGTLRRLGTHAPRELLCPGSAELVSTGLGANLGAQAGEAPATYIEIWIKSGPATRRSRRYYRPQLEWGRDRPIAANVTGPHSLSWRPRSQVQLARMAAGEHAEWILENGRSAYLVILSGRIAVDGLTASAEDGLTVSGPGRLSLRAEVLSEFLLVETEK